MNFTKIYVTRKQQEFEITDSKQVKDKSTGFKFEIRGNLVLL